MRSIAYTKSCFRSWFSKIPKSRILRIYESNIENPNFALARNAVQIDGPGPYYSWNQVSQNIPDAVASGLPEGFDYSPWVPNGQIASGGVSNYSGVDQVSSDWPTDEVSSAEPLTIEYFATAFHNPSVFDVWMTTQDWDPNSQLNWDQMEFLGRPDHTLERPIYRFTIQIPQDRTGRHVLWIAWQRDDPVGEVFFSASDILVRSSGSNPDPNPGQDDPPSEEDPNIGDPSDNVGDPSDNVGDPSDDETPPDLENTVATGCSIATIQGGSTLASHAWATMLLIGFALILVRRGGTRPYQK